MSNWKVIKTKIQVFDHPDAEKLQIGKVGTYQVVVQKGLYNGGETVLFAPEKSILSGALEREYKNYLRGKGQNRVGAVRLRGELSCGIIIPDELVFEQCGKHIDELPDDEDLSEILGITKYIPPVPTEMEGVAEPIVYDYLSIKHDVEQFGVYADNFVDGERVVITEKLHGSQIVAYAAFDGNEHHRWVSTKNYNADGLCLMESETNFYWRCVRNISLWEMIQDLVSTSGIVAGMHPNDSWVVQVFGEALPCQGLKYGFADHTMKIFGVAINGKAVPYDKLPDYFRKHWVPVLYDGPYDNVPELKNLALGNEQVSGKELHIKEGVVIRPYEDRRASDGTWLKVKVINPKYKETGEEFS